MGLFTAFWLLLMFVGVATFIRRDAISEGVSEKTAWYVGLAFGGLSLVLSLILVAVTT